jgi:hypothetical protein
MNVVTYSFTVCFRIYCAMNVVTYSLLSHLRCFRIYCAVNVVTYSFNSLLSRLLCNERCDLQFAFAFTVQ